jgi:hypothetical protein
MRASTMFFKEAYQLCDYKMQTIHDPFVKITIHDQVQDANELQRKKSKLQRQRIRIITHAKK